MLARPPHILSPPDVWDPDFPAKCQAWTRQKRSEMQELLARTERTIAETKALMKEADRIVAQSGHHARVAGEEERNETSVMDAAT